MKFPQVSTPLQEIQPELGFDATVGAAVDPAPYHELHSAPASKSGPGLRLPSFAKLGIEAPHSAPLTGQIYAKSPLSLGSLTSTLPLPFDSDTVGGGVSDMCTSDDMSEQIERAQHPGPPHADGRTPSLLNASHHFVTTLTPPDDEGNITWNRIHQLTTGPLGTPALSSDLGESSAGEAVAGEASGVPQITVDNTDPSTDIPMWIDGAIQTMRE